MFRIEIWEGARWHWDYGTKRGEAAPGAGDTLVFFYAPAGGDDPGFYGWAIVERCDAEEGTLYFTPVAPTDHLKMDPWWSKEAAEVADKIRGAMPRLTLFQVADKEVRAIRIGIRKWLRSPT